MSEPDTPTAEPRFIDIHCHYLPAVDDGARDLQDTIGLLRAARRDGVRAAILTPHIYAGRWDNNRSLLLPRFAAVQRLAASKAIDIELFLGAEVHLLPESLALIDLDEAPFLGGWDDLKVLLLELPDGRIPADAISAVRFLLSRDVLPVIAHPERNKAVMRDPDAIEPFVLEGCLLQLTAASLIGEFGAPAARTARALLDRGWATLVASDAHNLAHRPPRMKAAWRWLCKHYGEAVAAELTERAPGRILAGRARFGLDQAMAGSLR